MFPPTSRPRVPSKAALNALYQLAYISSGTAVGVAALCAEERRRRTVILSKIADNGRRLRESPSHVDNAVIDDGEEVFLQKPRWRRSPSQGRVVVKIPAKDDHLPSHVNKAYGQLQANARRSPKGLPVRQRRDASRSNFWSGREARRAKGSRDRVALELAKEVAPPEAAIQPSFKRVFGSDTIFKKWPPSRADRIPAQRLSQRSRAPNANNLSTVLRHGSEYATKSPMTAVAEPADLDTKLERFFLALGKVGHGTQYVVAGDLLLEEVLRDGTAAQARSLILWRFTTGKDQALNPHRLCKTLCFHIYSQIGRSSGWDGILEIMDEILDTGRMLRISEDLQLELRLAIVEAGLIRLGDAQKSVLVEKYLHSLWQRSDPASSAAQLEVVVKKWLREHRYPHAMRLLDAWEAFSHSMPMHLLSLVFTASMDHRRLNYCSTILLRSRSVEEITPELITNYELFILACGRKGMMGLLSGHFKRLTDDQPFIAALLPQLNANARAILSHADTDLDALTADMSVVLDNIFAAGLSSDIISKRVARRIKHKWRSTHDLAVVVDVFRQARKRAGDHNFPQESNLPMEIALIEVMSDAGCVDQALEMLSEISERGLEVTHVLCAGLVVLAKKGAWQQFGEMMTVLATRTDLTQDAYNLRNIERALYLYSLPHSADETWQYAVHLTGQLRISITQRMTTIVLQSFVYNGRLDLIRRWLDHANSLVGAANLDETTVGTLVQTFYLKHRPPHALFLNMCYTFLLQTGYRDHQPFIETAMESIGYDLRHNTANPSHMPAMLQLAAGNLQMMVGASGTFPRPLQIHHIERHREILKEGRPVTLRTPERDMGVLISDPEVELDADDELSGLQVDLQRRSKPKARKPKRDLGTIASGQDVEQNTNDGLSGVEASLEKRSMPEVPEPEKDLRTLTSDQEALDSVDKSSGVQDAAEMAHADDDVLKTPISFDHLREEQSDDDARRIAKADRRIGPWEVPDDLPLRPSTLEREMVFALSRRDFHHVLKLYRSSLGSGGMPASFRTLELAVEASLQESPGMLEGAKNILAEANAAGMNTAAARGSLLLMEMNSFTPEEKKNARILSNKVLDYHRANENSGLRIGRIVGVHAANILINNHCAQEGLRILRSLHTPDSTLYHPDDSLHAATRPTFNIVTLTVFLKAFVSLGRTNGIRWAVAYILHHNLRVDIAILNSLRNHVKVLSKQHQHDRNALPPRTRLALVKYLRDARLQLSARRSQQLLESARFGKKLLRCLREWRRTMLKRSASRVSMFEPIAKATDRRAQIRRVASRTTRSEPFAKGNDSRAQIPSPREAETSNLREAEVLITREAEIPVPQPRDPRIRKGATFLFEPSAGGNDSRAQTRKPPTDSQTTNPKILFEPFANDNDSRAPTRKPLTGFQPQNPKFRKGKTQSKSRLRPTMTAGCEHDGGELEHDALSHLMSPVTASG